MAALALIERHERSDIRYRNGGVLRGERVVHPLLRQPVRTYGDDHRWRSVCHSLRVSRVRDALPGKILART